ncbi:Multicopper oxidase mco [Seminavis robusta]|uniref:Multicopper oxidase mco n=1 Tax=Seminavis robusta TaxID=568900 RepID=A0A9N8EG55_9STRA|nr:Multicopper oxidase mco [Seminavis robusta]|eukprot:Sro896_g217340.1 Multicopper oxidase mco (630) ;mRNA; r:19341-21301
MLPSSLVALLSSAAILSFMAGPTLGATDFIDCNSPCNGGDANYELTASIRTMPMMNYTYKGRTYSREGDDTFMGPTMRVAPGQSLWIKLRNEIPMDLNPKQVEIEEYWEMLKKPGEKIKYQYYKEPVSKPEYMKVDHPNIPHNFDATNLHLHGLDVEVHMFDPVNTHNPDAPHISIEPGQCYCYRFNVPHHHPGGMYWYHPHLHGSTALQMWGGMLGVFYVDGPLEDEMAAFGVSNVHEFVIWDPALRAVHNEPSHNLEVDRFLLGQTTLSKIHPFLVNGKYNPTFTTAAGQVLWLRSLCATVENENTFIVYRQGEEDQPWDDAAIPFWVVGSDGVTYQKPQQKHILVMAGAQREEILLQFEEPGTYVISQQGIEGMQFFDMYGHPHNQILATIVVHELEAEKSSLLPNKPITDMRFTPGYDPGEDIQAHDIAKTETIVFTMGANRDQAPFPQYYVNGKSFAPDRIDFFAHPGEAVEYILINGNHNVHPFHIHVNRFQIQEMGSELSTETYPVLKHVMEFDPSVWRDTVVVPPNGRARIWVQYKNYTGKTVFHCHFLAHEDTGMMSTLFIGPPDYVFRLEENLPLLIGVAVGMVFAGVIFVVMGCRNGDQQTVYRPVATMNELKVKAQD